MTQEELDALMAGDLDLDDGAETAQDEASASDFSDVIAEPSSKLEGETEPDDLKDVVTAPPVTQEHKVVSQLDDVTRDSEVKAGEVFDALDGILANIEAAITDLGNVASANQTFEETFAKLHEKFPGIQKFSQLLETTGQTKETLQHCESGLQEAVDQVLGAMDTMQYQDIHRQKIERVINIMRVLSKYMNALFEGKLDDEARVKSAEHIHGDEDTEEVMSNDDIEALLAQFGS